MADTVKEKYKLDDRSISLCMTISLGVLQNITLCDWYIDFFSRSASKIEPKVRDILRCAVYQLLFMDKIPASAAVNEAVLLCKKLGYARVSGFCNAILRKLAACCPDDLPDIPGEGSAEYLSIKFSHPQWLAETIVQRRGYEAAKAFFAANNTAPETCLQVNTLKTTVSKLLTLLKSAGIACRQHEWLPDCIVASGSIAAMPGFDDGLFYVQDPAAKCAVLAAKLEPGMSVLDACAAPGGKSFAAAIAMQGVGHIDSCDLHEKKIHLIKSGADRLGIRCINAFAKDAKQPAGKMYDAIIADVPCSGYGVIRKKPEIRYKDRSEKDTLPAVQTEIIESLASSVKVGGVLIYSTCTVLKEENEDIVSSFLKLHPEFRAESFSAANGECATSGYITFWPDIHGTDGFFICKLRRVE